VFRQPPNRAWRRIARERSSNPQREVWRILFNITIDPDKENHGANGCAIDAAHEGTQVSDFDNYMLDQTTAMQPFQIENSADGARVMARIGRRTIVKYFVWLSV